MSSVPEDLRFTSEHVWARIEGEKVTLGLTEAFADLFGKVLDIELPEPGDAAEATARIAGLTASREGSYDLYSPVTGTIDEVNEDLFEDPDLIADDPYAEGWICTIGGVEPEEYETLLSPDEYDLALQDV
jgi:glycine cleavage system H protein